MYLKLLRHTLQVWCCFRYWRMLFTMQCFIQNPILLRLRLLSLRCIFRLVKPPFLLLMGTSALVILDDVTLIRHVTSNLCIDLSVML